MRFKLTLHSLAGGSQALECFFGAIWGGISLYIRIYTYIHAHIAAALSFHAAGLWLLCHPETETQHLTLYGSFHT